MKPDFYGNILFSTLQLYVIPCGYSNKFKLNQAGTPDAFFPWDDGQNDLAAVEIIQVRSPFLKFKFQLIGEKSLFFSLRDRFMSVIPYLASPSMG